MVIEIETDEVQMKLDLKEQVRAIISEGGNFNPELLDKYFREIGFTSMDVRAAAKGLVGV